MGDELFPKHLGRSHNIIQRLGGELQQLGGELQRAQGELQSIRGELQRTQGELQRTQGELQRTQGELQRTQGELQRTQGELQRTQEELQRTQAELQHTRNVPPEFPKIEELHETAVKQTEAQKDQDFSQNETLSPSPPSASSFSSSSSISSTSFPDGCLQFNDGEEIPSEVLFLISQELNATTEEPRWAPLQIFPPYDQHKPHPNTFRWKEPIDDFEMQGRSMVKAAEQNDLPQLIRHVHGPSEQKERYELSEKLCGINSRDYRMTTALHIAASRGYLEMATWLLENGADVRVRTITGFQV